MFNSIRSEAPEQNSWMNNSQIKILIVDDEEDILDFIQYNLQKEGFQVAVAKSGREGIDVANSFNPDLIILDIMMPEMDGVEVCRFLRNRKKFDDTLISFLTARNEDFTQIAALEVGGDDFITKPIRPRVLLARIQALLRRKVYANQQEKNSRLEYGELVIDKEKVLVIKGDRSIDLAKREFELICLLASKPGKVFNREEIFAKVWGTDVIVGNRTIDVHIRKLREKLGENYIKTVKGIGYKFEY